MFFHVVLHRVVTFTCPFPSRHYKTLSDDWVWSDRNIAGNAIFSRVIVRSTKTEDFLQSKVEGKSFQQAMEIILVPRRAGIAGANYDSLEPNIRKERGNVVKTAR